MLDIRLIREQSDVVKDGMRKRGDDPAIIDEVLRLDARRRELLFEVEQLKAAKNAASKQIGKIKDPVERHQRIAEIKAQGDRIPLLDREVAEVEHAFNHAMLAIPNLPHPDVPVGANEDQNIVIAQEGEPRQFAFAPRPHWELGEALDIIDFERELAETGTTIV